MWLLYDLLIHLYGDAIRVASLFNPKARAWVKGREGLMARLESSVGISRSSGTRVTADAGDGLPSLIWFHCASLGEFEQGRPVIESYRQEHPDCKILLTFFSPSGYEARKNYSGADWVFYLPLDTPGNARKFTDLIHPDLAVFVKYEFWFRYLDVLHRRKIPVFLVSANFRSGHHFFRWYGRWARKQLHKVTWFFLQNGESGTLLQKCGLKNITISGDTRFDRVSAIAKRPRKFPVVERFCGQIPVFIAGSTWPADEELILKMIEMHRDRIKFIIAPHEVGYQRTAALRTAVSRPQSARRLSSPVRTVLFSELDDQNALSAEVLIVDSIGLLAHLYQYATLVYIGGGFGAGIHNVLEAAAFGKPVIFGPKYQKFREATDLLEMKGAFSIAHPDQLNRKMLELLDSPDQYRQSAETCLKYVREHTGATRIIMDALSGNRA